MHGMNPLALSPAEFRRLAAEIAELSAEYLAQLPTRAIFPATSGVDCERLFALDLPENGLGPSALTALREVMNHSRAQNGRFFGYVQGPGEPIAALGDLFTSVINQNMTAWRSSPSAVTIERTVVRWLAQAVGCPGFTGTLTGGGSSANLMGLAMAREAKTPGNERGLWNSKPGVIYASTEIHMAVPKAAAMLGIGRENLRYIPCDDAYRMIPAELERAIVADKAQGLTPIAVVASAGTVNTGAVDPFPEISRIARAHGTWLHVDGAYGGLAAIAAPEKCKGLELVDSLAIDPHKWLYQPLDCGCLLYRDLDMARQTFKYTGTYAKQLSSDPIEGFAFFEESMELSRRCRALKLWLSLRYHGLERFRAAIRRDLQHAQQLARAIDAEPALERLAPVELSAVCFRHRISESASGEQRNAFNLQLLKRLILRGKVYLSNAELRGKFCLRACIVNHMTTDADIETVVREVLETAREISESSP
jgi:glutamate/tyrosine decarboxylase-like PLP-dependent enzyme